MIELRWLVSVDSSGREVRILQWKMFIGRDGWSEWVDVEEFITPEALTKRYDL